MFTASAMPLAPLLTKLAPTGRFTATLRRGIFLVLLMPLSACAGHAGKTQEARSAMDAGHDEEALKAFNEALDVKSEKEIPNKVESEEALLLLDRGLVLQELGNYSLSARDLEVADKAIMIADFSKSTLDDIAKYTLSGDAGEYQAPSYEKLLLNTLNMINYLARGDLSGARVEARRYSIIEKYIRDNDPDSMRFLGIGGYIAGYVYEKSGNAEEALRYYDEALKAANFQSLDQAVLAQSRRSPYRTPKLKEAIARAEAANDPSLAKPTADVSTSAEDASSQAEPAQKSEANNASAAGKTKTSSEQKNKTGLSADKSTLNASNKEAAADSNTPSESEVSISEATTAQSSTAADAEVLVIIQYGRVPSKIAIREHIGKALVWGGVFLSVAQVANAQALAAQGLVTWVNYSDLEPSHPIKVNPGAKLEQNWLQLESAIDIDREARVAYEAVRGKIIAAAIVRTLTRAAVGTGAGAAAGSGSDSSAVGMLVSMGVQAAMVAADTPDTRCWATLPSQIAVARVKLPAGKHQLELSAQGVRRKVNLELKPGESKVLNLSVLR